MASELKNKTAKGLVWGGMGNTLTQVAGMVFGIFLARILNAEDYGIVGLLAIFTQIANSFVESGFIKALINRPSIKQNDYNAVFWFSILTGLVLYGILFFCAPLIARFYHDFRLVWLSRYVFLSIIISSLGIAPIAYMYKKLMVKQRAITSWTALLISNTVGITMAINGFSYWGIATQALLYNFITVSMNGYLSRWRPSFHISFSPIKEMFSYSIKLLLTNILRIINNNIFVIFFAKFFSLHIVGNYNQANKWANMAYSSLSGTMTYVIQPVLSTIATEKERHYNAFRKMVRFSAFMGFPLLFGLAFIAKEFILIVLTEKWIESASMLSILSIGYAFFLIAHVFSELVAERGRSDMYLYVSALSGILQILCLVLLHDCGIKTILVSYVGIQLLSLLLWFGVLHKEISYKLKHFFTDTFSYAGIAGLSIFLAHICLRDIHNMFLLLFGKILLVAALYIGILYLLKAAMLRECIRFLKQIFRHSDF